MEESFFSKMFVSNFKDSWLHNPDDPNVYKNIPSRRANNKAKVIPVLN
jgi:hypothetical protein